MRGTWRGLAMLIGLLLFAVGLAACGNDDAGQTSPSGERGAASADSRGGEASIEDFGSEASGEERGSIEGAFVSYLSALVAEDPAAACPYLSATTKRSLEQFVAPDRRGKGCPAALARLLAPAAPSIAHEQLNGEIVNVRVDGDRAFVLFKAPGAKLFQMAMAYEDGEWKMTTVVASVLVPAL